MRPGEVNAAPGELEVIRMLIAPALPAARRESWVEHGDLAGWLRALVGSMQPPGPAGEVDQIRHKLFLTVREAALYSGLPQSAIRRLIARNELPAVKLGSWRIKRSYLERLELRHLRRLAEETR
jgi:excisionase family DNA binding protein